MDFWQDKCVLVTGSTGFLGTHVVKALRLAGASVFQPLSFLYDLRNPGSVAEMFEEAGQVDVLFHLAAVVGGIGANMREPATFYYDNTLMNALIVEYTRRFHVGKLVCVGSVCAYPKYPNYPFREEHLFEGYPEETNAPYGISKRGLLVHLQAARRQYGLNGIYLIPTNLYGPEDDFDLETSHVIPALIRKFIEARDSGAETVPVWGSGEATRDFLYVADCAQALLLAAEWYDGMDPVNLGSGQEVRIAWLAEMIKAIVGFKGGIIWDKSKPDGQPRRVLNTGRAWDAFKWKASTPIEEGLRETIEWYEHLSLPETALAGAD